MLMAVTIAQFLTAMLVNQLPNHRDPTQSRDAPRMWGAVNGVMEEWFATAGPVFTVNDDSSEFFPPLPVTVNVTQDSTAFSFTSGIPGVGYPTSASTIGQALIAAGDAQVLNRVEQDGVLWRPYLGTSGAVSAILFTDTAVFADTDFEIIGPVRYTGFGYTYPVDLDEWGEMNPWMTAGLPEYPMLAGYYGRPLAYITDSHQPTAGTNSPYWYLRVWPMPAGRGNVSYKLKSQPPVFSQADFATQRLVPVPDQYIPLLVNLAQEHLMVSPFWNPAADKVRAQNLVEKARLNLSGKLAVKDTSAAPNRQGTPRGF